MRTIQKANRRLKESSERRRNQLLASKKYQVESLPSEIISTGFILIHEVQNRSVLFHGLLFDPAGFPERLRGAAPLDGREV